MGHNPFTSHRTVEHGRKQSRAASVPARFAPERVPRERAAPVPFHEPMSTEVRHSEKQTSDIVSSEQWCFRTGAGAAGAAGARGAGAGLAAGRGGRHAAALHLLQFLQHAQHPRLQVRACGASGKGQVWSWAGLPECKLPHLQRKWAVFSQP